MIPMVNLKQQYADIKDEVDKGLREVFDTSTFILGPNVHSFEQEASEYLGVKHAIGVASGTDALQITLDAEGIGPGDEVITTAFTFIATAESIRKVGATPVFVDIDPKTFNISPEAIDAAVTSKTAAIMPVHLFGQPADMKRIQDICNKYSFILIEDCAQSFGAEIDHQQTGSFGTSAGFSFFPSKNLGCYGDGGLITTDSDQLADKIKILRNHGSHKRYHHEIVGYNSRLDEIQAVILRVKLKRIDEYNKKRRRAAHLYSDLMTDVPVTTPHEDNIGHHVYHQYTILTDARERIIKSLQEASIASAVYYPIPLHKQGVFMKECAGIKLPITERISERCLSLPIFPELSIQDINRIVDVVKSAFLE